MTPEQQANLIRSSALAWVALNKMQTENQQLIEFEQHRFLIDIYADEHHDIVCRKSAQCGGSVCFIFKAGHVAGHQRENVIYVLPTQNIVKDFVQPKVDPLIASNPAFAKLVTKDSVSLKQVGDRFLYFKGASSEREAIAISGDLLILDELDRMPDMSVVNTYDSRLQASKHPRRWRLSNPSGINFGIDALYLNSDQRHWFITCPSCKWEYFIDFEPTDERNHFLMKQYRDGRDTRPAFVCGKCLKELSNDDRKNGRWIRRYNNRDSHGYWINQLMVPYVSARRVLDQYEESNIEFFHNFVLGKAYTPSDMRVDRATILRACVPSTIAHTGVAMGVDQKASDLQWVAGTPQGIFAYGHAKSWEEIEDLKLMWQAVLVMDAAPYPTGPKKLAEKYPDAYMCYFPNRVFQGINAVEWKDNSVVQADRTRLLDIVAAEISEAKLIFRMRPYELEEYIADWQNIYRTTTEEPDGRTKSEWLKKDNKESDFSFATAYMRIALSRVLASGGMGKLIEPDADYQPIVTDTMTKEGVQTTLNKSVEDAFADMD